MDTTPETLRSLTSPDLDKTLLLAMMALKAAQEAVLDVQDERYRRFRVVRMLSQQPDWPEGELPEAVPTGLVNCE